MLTTFHIPQRCWLPEAIFDDIQTLKVDNQNLGHGGDLIERWKRVRPLPFPKGKNRFTAALKEPGRCQDEGRNHAHRRRVGAPPTWSTLFAALRPASAAERQGSTNRSRSGEPRRSGPSRSGLNIGQRSPVQARR